MEDSAGGPERETLRGFLRQLEAPEPPAELEDDLRRAFRARTKDSRWGWLAAAAAVAVVVAGLVLRFAVSPTEPTPRTVASSSPTPGASPTAPPAAATPDPAPAAVVQAPRLHATPSHQRRPPEPPSAQVVVEPGQAELLARFGRDLQGLPEVALHDRTATMAAANWEPVSDEWPLMHWSHPHTSEDPQ